MSFCASSLTSPCLLYTSTAVGSITLEMEKVLNAMPGDQKVKAERVLEINASRPVYAKLQSLVGSDEEKLRTYAGLLYNQALLMEGLPIDDPVAFSNQICTPVSYTHLDVYKRQVEAGVRQQVDLHILHPKFL